MRAPTTLKHRSGGEELAKLRKAFNRSEGFGPLIVGQLISDDMGRMGRFQGLSAHFRSRGEGSQKSTYIITIRAYEGRGDDARVIPPSFPYNGREVPITLDVREAPVTSYSPLGSY